MALRISRSNAEKKITENFRYKEHFCKCGECDVQLLDIDLYRRLEHVRACFGGNPVTITSGYRCPAHNIAVGGAPKSKHMEGHAADLKIAGVEPFEIARTAREAGFTGIKVYDSWVHVDLRQGATWFVGLDK